jgi:uncharacterized oligopeptide transporter (OPT) family protein
MSGAASTENAEATPPGLPDLAEVPEGQRDQKWLEHYYQRGVPQLTVRAVVTGGILGMIMSLANLYTTLHVGWSFGVAITSGVLAYVIWGGLGRIPGMSQMTLLENNCMQSTASAAGYSTGGTLATAVGAMLLISGDEERLGWVPVAVWVFLTGCLGVFLAIPMKRQMINQEQLPFPSGIAAAATMRSLYAQGRESVLAARALVGALVAGSVLAVVRDVMEWIPGFLPFPFRIFRARETDFTGATLTMGFEPSLLLIAAGMIVGIRVCTWMLVGALANYTLLVPWAASQPDWHEDGKTFFGHVESIALATPFPAGTSEVDGDAAQGIADQLNAISSSGTVELVGFANVNEENAPALARTRAEHVRDALVAHGISADRITIGETRAIDARDGSRRVIYQVGGHPVTLGVRVTRWSLWFGTAMLVASGLTSFALGWRTILRAFQKLRQARAGGKKEESEMDQIEVPTSWFVMGMIPITIGLVALCWLSLSINPILGVISVALSFFISLVACRATGETDTTPIGPLGKITQFIYAVLAPGNTTINLMTAGITSGAAGASADLLTDLKSGYLLGANPRQQFIAQASGVIFGTLAVVPAWYAMAPDRATLDAINSPATSMWYAVAMALSHGVETIPETARWAIGVGAILGIVIALGEALAPKEYKKWVPSSMGLGLAFVVPFQNSFSFFIGAVITFVWTKVHKASADRYVIPAASGAIAGESVTSAGYALWGTFRGLLGLG